MKHPIKRNQGKIREMKTLRHPIKRNQGKIRENFETSDKKKSKKNYRIEKRERENWLQGYSSQRTS